MKQKCVDAVESAAGRPLRAGEAKDITDRINKNYRILAQTRPDEFSAMSHEQKLQEAARMAAEELKSDAIKEKQRIALKIKAFDNVDKYATQQKQLGISKIESLKRIMASYSDGKSNIQSVEMRGSAIAKLSISRMLKTLEAIQPKALGLFANKEGTKALTYALYGEHDKIENPELRKIATTAAEQWLKVAENLRKAFNSAGGQIGKLENWAFPQNHSQTLIAKAGREKWVNDILPALNRKKYINEDFTYMNDSQMREFLGKSWENIATGGANKADLKDNLQPSMKARRHAEERVLHFKDADSFLGYQDKYAEKDTYTTIVNHMDRLSKDIAMLDVLGPNPDAMFKTLLNKYVAEEAKAEPLKAKKILKKATSAQNLYDYIAGKTIPVASEAIARTFDTAQNLIIASHMGTAIVTSLPHSAAMHVTAAIQGISSFKMMRNQLDTYNPLNKTERHIAERAGLALDTFTSQINRWGTDSLGAMFSQKLSNLTMRVSGFNAIIEARKRAFGVTMYGAIGKSLQDNARLADLPKWDKRMLESKGTTETHFQVWKKAELEDWGRGNNTMITPESIYRIPDEEVAKVIAPVIEGIKQNTTSEIANMNEKINNIRASIEKKADTYSAAADKLKKIREDFTARRKEWIKEDLQGADKHIENFTERRNKYLDHYEEKIKIQNDILKNKYDRAEAEADIASFLKLETNINKITQFLRGVEDGAKTTDIEPKAKRTLEDYGQARSQIGEKLGAKRAALEAKSQELENKLIASEKLFQSEIKGRADVREAKISEREKNFRKEIKIKSKEIDNKIIKLGSKATESIARSKSNISKIQAAIDYYQGSLDSKINSAITTTKNEAALQLLGHVLEETNMAIVTATAAERASMMQGIQRGTLKGELARSFYLFKGFPIAVFSKHLNRAWNMPTGTAKAAYAASFIAGTTLLGAVSTQIFQLLTGKDPYNMTDPRFLGMAFLKGGAMGIYGEFLFNTETSYGSSPLATFAGPLTGSIDDLFRLTQGNLLKKGAGQNTTFKSDLVRNIKNNIPLQNLWYTRAAMDRLIFNQLQEMASPGYMDRVEERARNTYNQRYWWHLKDTTPSRAPDFQRALGQ